MERLEAWDEEEFEEDGGWFNDESAAFVGSLIVHLAILLLLGLTPLTASVDPEAVVLVASKTPDDVDDLRVIDEVDYSDVPQDEVGANSTADSAMAEASAEMFSQIAEIPSPVEMEPDIQGDIFVNNVFTRASAPLQRIDDRRGKVGEAVDGSSGAIDRLTHEILLSLEERPTLVVWLFDLSYSLVEERSRIIGRFDDVYEELGIVIEQRKERLSRAEQREIPLLTSVVGFGNEVKLFTEQPTDDLAQIKDVVHSLPFDKTGIERPFTAVELAVDKYKPLVRDSSQGPGRNVMLVVVTDERGDDIERLEPAIRSCRRFGMPVYVIGTPAPFGREHVLIKYIDPDPNYDQTPQWGQVDAGPESLMPEVVRVGFSGDFREEPVIDSGFGPYGLTRLAYETGGIFFIMHPNRNVNRDVKRSEIEPFASDIRRFFDPSVMARYRPDYLSPEDYEKKVRDSPLRTALVTAAMQEAPALERPRMRFVKRSDAQLAGDLTTAQQDAAKLEPALLRLASILEPGMKVRDQETSPRWRAGYELSMGRVLAQKVRAETYNAMLAKAKRGMPFEDEKNNTWVIEPADEISVGSKWEREADFARELLESVVEQHPETPWAHLAAQELETPLGWRWKEAFTDLSPRPRRSGGNNNNNNNRSPRDDEARKIDKAPKRPIPKL